MTRPILMATRIRLPIKAYSNLSLCIAAYVAKLSAASPGSVHIPNVHMSLIDFGGSELFSLKKRTRNRCRFFKERREVLMDKVAWEVAPKNSLKVIPVKFIASRKSQKAQQKLMGSSIIEKMILKICCSVITRFTFHVYCSNCQKDAG